jgi:hypothetical protein
VSERRKVACVRATRPLSLLHAPRDPGADVLDGRPKPADAARHVPLMRRRPCSSSHRLRSSASMETGAAEAQPDPGWEHRQRRHVPSSGLAKLALPHLPCLGASRPRSGRGHRPVGTLHQLHPRPVAAAVGRSVTICRSRHWTASRIGGRIWERWGEHAAVKAEYARRWSPYRGSEPAVRRP